ncbi:hypothetical protein N9N47_00735 [Candidatus Pelagibacter bacterium]|nr:hypothetical protein [Candidatus Pelagibacter bacterium]MDA8836664.1 hypothetical protein [Candidatus Pelagibacter bacterium]
MVKNKNNMAIWGSRIKKDASTLFQKVGNSIDIDKKLFQEDILGSIVHVEMLFRQKIISFKIKNKIIFGLNKIEKEILKNQFTIENNMMTPTLKLKRYKIIKTYQNELEKLFN